MNSPSTENLKFLPNPSELKQICKSISTLEAILCQEWEYRYYSYQKDWSQTEEVCETRNGQGDHMLILFSDFGTCINGFARESKMNGWKKVKVEENKSFIKQLFGKKKEEKTKLIQEISIGILDDLPNIFHEFIYGEPIASIGTTFCIWQLKDENEWQIGNHNLPDDEYKDGSKDLLALLDGKPSTYHKWAEEYYEQELNLRPVEKVFNREIITQDLVNELNPNLEDYEKLKSDLDEIGYEFHFKK